jgi:hypothetical protein
MAALIEVKSEKDVTKFEEIATTSGAFSEAWLQEVLRQHPDILPVEELWGLWGQATVIRY